MEDTKLIITESRNRVNALLQDPEINTMEKLQYKVMAANLNTMLQVIDWLQNMRQSQKTK